MKPKRRAEPQGPTFSLPDWSLLKHTALFPASIAWLMDSKGKWPFPGLPLSVKAPSPGSPVRSVGCRVMSHPVGSSIRLYPRDVIGPEQSRVPALPGVLRARSVFNRTNVPRSFPMPPPSLSARVVLRNVAVPTWLIPQFRRNALDGFGHNDVDREGQQQVLRATLPRHPRRSSRTSRVANGYTGS